MKRIASCLIPALGLISLSLHLGCQGPTLVTTASPPSSGPVEGMLYYLPVGKITIKGEYAKTEATATPTATATPNPTKQDAAEDAGGASELMTNASRQASVPKKNPTNDGNEGEPGGGTTAISGGQLTITVTSRVEADQEAGVYYVTPQTNDIFEDEVQVTVNAKKLLSAGKVTTEDKTAEIVGTIASLAAQAAARAYVAPKESRQPFYFSFDPSNRGQVDFVREQLQQRGVGLKVSTDAKGEILDAKTVKQMALELGRSGLIFRPGAAYNIRLTYPVDVQHGTEPPKGQSVIIKDTEQFILPDRTKLCVMKYDRMAFVKKVREVGFSDGMLTDFHQKRPSPILGFLGIPKAILQAIVPIPGAAGPSGSASTAGTTGPKN